MAYTDLLNLAAVACATQLAFIASDPAREFEKALEQYISIADSELSKWKGRIRSVLYRLRGDKNLFPDELERESACKEIRRDIEFMENSQYLDCLYRFDSYHDDGWESKNIKHFLKIYEEVSYTKLTGETVNNFINDVRLKSKWCFYGIEWGWTARTFILLLFILNILNMYLMVQLDGVDLKYFSIYQTAGFQFLIIIIMFSWTSFFWLRRKSFAGRIYSNNMPSEVEQNVKLIKAQLTSASLEKDSFYRNQDMTSVK